MNGTEMKLVVIGNAEPTEDLSTQIDQCDMVVRFNYTPYFDTGTTGCKTTILCLFGVPYPEGDEVPGLNTEVVKNSLGIWVGAPMFIGSLVRGYDVPRQKILLVSLPEHDAYKTEQIVTPTSGFQVLRFLVNSPWFAVFDKFICGFTWQGGPKHPWEQEKRQVAHYVEIGLLHHLTKS